MLDPLINKILGNVEADSVVLLHIIKNPNREAIHKKELKRKLLFARIEGIEMAIRIYRTYFPSCNSPMIGGVLALKGMLEEELKKE